jgi:L-fuconolactonase
VDSHHHVWDLTVRPQPYLDSSEGLAPLRRNFLLDELKPLAAAAGVTATVMVQTVSESAETPELLVLAEAEPLVAAVVGWTDLTDPAVSDALAALRTLPGAEFLAGIRHPLLTESDPEWITRPAVRRGLAALAAHDLVFDLVLRPSLMPAATDAARESPGVTFVLDHLGNVEVERSAYPAWASAITRFASLPNTACKLSGILGAPAPQTAAADADGPVVDHLRPFFDLALQLFGPGRMMFGSDWPVSTMEVSYTDVVARARALIADLSEPEQQAILAGTAERIYRLGGNQPVGTFPGPPPGRIG